MIWISCDVQGELKVWSPRGERELALQEQGWAGKVPESRGCGVTGILHWDPPSFSGRPLRAAKELGMLEFGSVSWMRVCVTRQT